MSNEPELAQHFRVGENAFWMLECLKGQLLNSLSSLASIKEAEQTVELTCYALAPGRADWDLRKRCCHSMRFCTNGARNSGNQTDKNAPHPVEVLPALARRYETNCTA